MVNLRGCAAIVRKKGDILEPLNIPSTPTNSKRSSFSPLKKKIKHSLKKGKKNVPKSPHLKSSTFPSKDACANIAVKNENVNSYEDSDSDVIEERDSLDRDEVFGNFSNLIWVERDGKVMELSVGEPRMKKKEGKNEIPLVFRFIAHPSFLYYFHLV